MIYDLQQLKNSWSSFGVVEPYWSVLTDDKFKNHQLNQESLDIFYQTGKSTILEFEKILNNHQSTFFGKTVLDFGCGVGRLIKPVSELCKKAYGLDISQPHLDIAKKAVPEAEFFLVENCKKLPISISPDIIYSYITLQHNRPILIKIWLTLLLKSLLKHGIALLHIPYDIVNYTKYTDQLNRMEMHFLDKATVQKISEFCGCTILSEIETRHCGANIFECIYVIEKK